MHELTGWEPWADDDEPPPRGRCPECGATGPCEYDLQGRPLRHVDDEEADD